MEDYNSMVNRHKRRWSKNNETVANDALSEGIDNFNNLIDNMLAPTVHNIKRTEPREINIDKLINDRMLVSDISRVDNDVTDRKLFNFKLTSNITCGCYIHWFGEWWILCNEENNSFQTHKTFVAKKCNTIINYGYNGNIYRYPIALTNLTIYSDGLTDKVNMSLMDSKSTMLISKNDITETILMNIRIMVNKTMVYKVSLVDNFTTEGVLQMNMAQELFNSKDDKENNIAWNDVFNHECAENPFFNIIGNDVIYLGDINEYSFEGAISWEIESVDNCLSIEYEGDICKVTCSSNSKYANTIAILRANGNIEKEIIIRGVF